MADKYASIEKDALWVMQYYGSNAQERKTKGSKAKSQAKRIAEFVRQWDEAADLLSTHGLDLIAINSALEG